MTQHTAHKKVVVIGGGYSGTLAANHLRMRGDVDITLINPRPKFVERIRLHQLVAGTHEATVDYGSLLGEGIRLVVDTATRIDAAARQVELGTGRALDYDYVIYAVGSTGAVPASVPGAAEFAYPIAELEQAQRLRAAIDNLHPDAPVTVVGAGLTGIESATELAEKGHNVTLVCGGQLGPYLSEPGRRSVAKVMRRLGVVVLETDVVTEVRPNAVVFADGAVRPSALTIWTAGFGVPELAAASGSAHRRDGSAAHRRDADQRGRRPHRRRGRLRLPVGRPPADVLRFRLPARATGRQHGAEPDRGHPARGFRLRRSPEPASAWAESRASCRSPARTTRR